MNKKDVYEKLIGDVEDYKGIVYLVCCIGVEYDYDIVSHSIKYYKKLGVDKFLFVLNTENKNSEKLIEVQNILREYSIEEEEVWIGEFEDFSKKERIERIIKKNAAPEDWVVEIDADEFQEYYVDLRKFISYCEKMNYDCVCGNLVDRLTENGELIDINDDTNIWEAFPVKTSLEDLGYANYNKILLRKAYVDTYGGHHHPSDPLSCKICRCNFPVYHFKWRGALLENHKNRLVIFKKLGFIHWKHSKIIIDRYRKNGNFK